MSLAKQGWDLSMQQESTPYGEYCLRLAMRHSGARLYAVSSPIMLEYGRIAASVGEIDKYVALLKAICFRIQVIAPEIQFHSLAEVSGPTLASRFDAIDPFPQNRVYQEDISNFKFFKVANPSIQDIIVTPDQVPELLELILKTQSPEQAAIRARERSRANTRWVREGMGEVKPAHQVQAQIITLAS